MFNKKGFTLIELLIVVLLIGILSGIALSVINPRGVRAKARDAQRIGDLKTIQVALETYYSDNREYPPALSDLVGSYISTIPPDPLGGSVSETCDGNNISSYGYHYYRQDQSNYSLIAIMEIMTSGSKQDSYCEVVNNPL